MEDLLKILIEIGRCKLASLDTCMIPMLMTQRVSVTISRVSAII
jgi:hypothetical protein